MIHMENTGHVLIAQVALELSNKFTFTLIYKHLNDLASVFYVNHNFFQNFVLLYVC